MAHTMNVPVEFQGSREEADENYASHAFSYDPDGDSRCYFCDSRPSYAAALYPCGADVPRETVYFLEPGETVEFRNTTVLVQRQVPGTSKWGTSAIATAPSNGDPMFLTGVEGLRYVVRDEVTAR